MSTHYIEEAERLADTVTIMSHGRAVAVGPPADARRRARRRARRSRSTARRRGSPRSRRAARARRRCARGAPARAIAVLRRRRADGCRRRAPPGQPRGRLRAAHRRGDRVRRRRGLRRARPPRAPGAGRRARPRGRQLLLVLALDDVLLDRRADDLPARLRLRLRLAGHDGRRLRLRGVRRHRHGGHRGALLSASSRRCSGPSSSTSSSAPTTRSSRRRSTPRSSSPPRRCGSRTRAGVYGSAPLLVAMVFGLDPSWGMLTVPFIGFLAGFGWGAFGIMIAGDREVDRQLQLRERRGAHAAVPRRRHLLPAHRAARVGAGRWASSTRCTTASSSCATRRSAGRAGPTSATSRCIVGFGLVMWRLAIVFLQRRLID